MTKYTEREVTEITGYSKSVLEQKRNGARVMYRGKPKIYQPKLTVKVDWFYEGKCRVFYTEAGLEKLKIMREENRERRELCQLHLKEYIRSKNEGNDVK